MSFITHQNSLKIYHYCHIVHTDFKNNCCFLNVLTSLSSSTCRRGALLFSGAFRENSPCPRARCGVSTGGPLSGAEGTASCSAKSSHTAGLEMVDQLCVCVWGLWRNSLCSRQLVKQSPTLHPMPAPPRAGCTVTSGLWGHKLISGLPGRNLDGPRGTDDICCFHYVFFF